MNRFLLIFLATGSLQLASTGQWYESADFAAWDQGKVEKFLEKSPWVKSTTYRPSNPRGSIYRSESGARASIYFRVRWFSARPVRMAMARQALALNPQLTVEQLTDFATAPSEQVVLALVLDANDAGFRTIQGYQRVLQRMGSETIQPLVTLETKSGKKIHPSGYQPPGPDGSSAKFIFPRTLAEGQPLLVPEDREARFRFTFEAGRNDKIRIDTKFKLKDMMLVGKLEY